MKFIDENEARLAASREVESGPQRDDPHFSDWQGAVPGEPHMVHDLLGRPGYWMVPIKKGNDTIGAVRVLGSGQAAASISHRQGSNLLALNETQILKEASASIATAQGETVGKVLLVHDGPPGREVWRVEVLSGDRVIRWLFVGPGGIYERAVGAVRDETEE